MGQEAFPLLHADDILGNLFQPLVWSNGETTELSAQGTAEPGVNEGEGFSVTLGGINPGVYVVDGKNSKADNTRRLHLCGSLVVHRIDVDLKLGSTQ